MGEYIRLLFTSQASFVAKNKITPKIKAKTIIFSSAEGLLNSELLKLAKRADLEPAFVGF